MGRPLNKNKLSGTGYHQGTEHQSSLAGNIAVTAYRPSGGSKVDSTTAYIVSQRSSRKYKIQLDDSSTGVYTLMAVAPASLANTQNEFCVQIILNDSTVAYVSRFYNNLIHYVDNAGNTGSCTYTLGAEGTDEGGGAGASAEGIKSGSVDVR